MGKNKVQENVQEVVYDDVPEREIESEMQILKAENKSPSKSIDTSLTIDGRMKVKTLQAQFKEVFGLTLRMYDGRSFADESSTLASIRKGDAKGGEFSARRNMLVGNFEDKILSQFGIKVQIAGSDDSYLCNNDLTLMAAWMEDGKKIAKKQN